MRTAERTIGATPAQVWKHLGDLDNWAAMLPTIDEIARLTEGPTTVGSRFRVNQPGLPAAEYAVTDWRPDAGFTWEARTAGLRTVAIHELEPTEGGTRLRVGIAWHGPLAWLIRLLFTRKAERYLAQEADTFTALAESSTQP